MKLTAPVSGRRFWIPLFAEFFHQAKKSHPVKFPPAFWLSYSPQNLIKNSSGVSFSPVRVSRQFSVATHKFPGRFNEQATLIPVAYCWLAKFFKAKERRENRRRKSFRTIKFSKPFPFGYFPVAWVHSLPLLIGFWWVSGQSIYFRMLLPLLFGRPRGFKNHANDAVNEWLRDVMFIVRIKQPPCCSEPFSSPYSLAQLLFPFFMPSC